MVLRNERVQFPGGSGFELAGILDLPVGEPQATALFTHCFTCNKDLKAIVRISRRLAEQGCAVLRYDLTGLGGSRGDFSTTNFTTNQADLRAAAEFLARRLWGPDLLIGHSFGAACSLSQTQQLASVQAVVSIAGPSDTQHLASILERLNPSLKSAESGEVHIGGRNYIITRQMLEDFLSHDLGASLRQLGKPALLFHSLRDETLGYDHVLRLFGLLSGRGSGDAEAAPTSLISLASSDHLLTNHADDPSYLADSIWTWFRRVKEA